MSDLSAEKVGAELRALAEDLGKSQRATRLRGIAYRVEALIAQQAARLEEVTRERDEARAAAGDTTWFWKIVDAQGLNNVSSDEVVALRELVDGFAALTAAEAEKERLTRALTFLGENNSRSLTFDGKFYCEDDNSDLWVVTEARGGINDREWVLLGSGKTPAEALLSATALSKKEQGA